MLTYVLVYDVVNTSRRSRLHRRLKKWMVPVQKSVFEGRLTAKALGEVEGLIHLVLDLEEDAVRLYALNKTSIGLTRSFGVQGDREDPDQPVLL